MPSGGGDSLQHAMESGASGWKRWSEDSPIRIDLTPSHLLYGLAVLLLIVTYMRTRRLLAANKPSRNALSGRIDGKAEALLKLRTVELFREIQKAWAERDGTMLERRLERRLLTEWRARRPESPKPQKQVTEEVGIVGVSILNAKEHRDDARDEYTARIDFAIVDAAGEKGPGSAASAAGPEAKTGIRRGSFAEYWTFARRDGEWRVRAVMRNGVLVPISLALEPTLQEDDARHT
jgi:predicted lipid-binding transport protein (Tim44 family)